MKADANFFDRYPLFYETSWVGSAPNRLNSRFRLLIERNADCIRNHSVLDLASHDGRWSFSALKAGASHVLGIEARSALVEKARQTFRTYEVSETQYTFIVGDVHHRLPLLPAASVDTVFCFGFFYHTLHHHLLLSQLAALRPKHLLLDTRISRSTESVIEVRTEDSHSEASAVPSEGQLGPFSLVGRPSWKALTLMLRTHGFSVQPLDWRAILPGNWAGIEDYRDRRRIAVRCQLGDPSTVP